MALQQASSLVSSVHLSTCSYTYDVFLSFRGEDTRHGFTDHLYTALVHKGIHPFRDENELPRGEEISEALLRAIDESKLSLIVFSEKYASSKWCLDELVHILGRRRAKKQMVCPIFYKVDPSDVRKQEGKFGKALASLKCRFEDGRVSRWREALTEAANLSGWHFSDNGYESKFIEGIIEEINAKVIKQTPLDVAKFPVGIGYRVQDILDLLDVGGSDIRMVGIWGTGGIGKTTIAKAVYNAIVNEFEHSCFLANVRELSVPHEGLVNLQKKILGKEELKLINADQGITLLKKWLRGRRTLLVLDDVDQLNQLEKLAGGLDWFAGGSRIIITTRDKHLLIAHQVSQIYQTWQLDSDEACALFCANGFVDYEDLEENDKLIVTSVVEYAHGIPLALEVLGSALCDTPINEWPAMLDGFKRDPPKRIQDILTISYDGLQESVKQVFLDIACFFKGWERNNVIQILEGCDRINPKYSIQVLEKKALIYVERYNDNIRMHDLLEEMGKVKVLQESTEPGERSRLWHYKDVLDVLTENRGTSKVESIMVKMPTADEIQLSRKCFKKMKNLKMFINVNGRFVGKVDYLPNQLRVLDWPDCPLQSLPSNFDTRKLVHFNMSGSRISHLGKAFKSMQNLTSLNFESCEFLTEIPDLSGIPNLEYLNLSWCKRLVEIHHSVGSLEKLVKLNLCYCPNLLEVHPSVGSLEKLVELHLYGCSKLVKLPEKVNWRSLRELDLRLCTSLESFPEIVGEMKHITSLKLFNTGIKALPSSIRNLINLEELDLSNSRNLTDLPRSIYELQKLTKVELWRCPNLVTFPVNKVESEVVPTYSKANSHVDDHRSLSGSTSMDNLMLPRLGFFEFNARGCNLSNMDFMASLVWASTLFELDLSDNPIAVLPECIKEFVNLRNLYLIECKSLVEIPELPSSIERLDVSDCLSLERISKLSNILERKESQMVGWMNLTNCWRLCQNLVDEMAKEEEDEVILFCRLLSSQQSSFTVIFPVQRIEVPNWFSCQMDFMGHHPAGFEFWIETLPNFKWDNNNTGLALCVAVCDPGCSFEVFIYINEERVSDSLDLDCEYLDSDNVWVRYVPFHEMCGFMRPRPPFTCQVIIQNSEDDDVVPIERCGVHLVMPPNEDDCMQLLRAEILTCRHSLFDEGDDKAANWDIYRTSQTEEETDDDDDDDDDEEFRSDDEEFCTDDEDKRENYRPKQRTECTQLYTDDDAQLENPKRKKPRL